MKRILLLAAATIGLLAFVVMPPTGSGQAPLLDVQLPSRAAFVYQWFPTTWTVSGAHVSYRPINGYYSSDDQAVMDDHIRQLDWGKFEVAIASWWGPNSHNEQARVPLALNRTAALGSNLKWALYYEDEGFGNPSLATVRSDLAYIKARYTNHSSYARVAGKPVLFVYNADDTTCAVADKWRQAAPEFYVVLKVMPGWNSCAAQPQGWHQYGPASPTHNIGNSYSISPGYTRADGVGPRLARDPARWSQNIRSQVASGKAWQLVTTFNEWGEGSSVEEAREWETVNRGVYLDALHNDGSVTAPQGPGEVTVLAAGDVQNPSAGNPTRALLAATPKDAVIGMGDLQYNAGSLANFNQYWAPNWGTAAPNSKFYPAPGNHESTKGGYCTYFGGKTPVDVCPISPNSARQRYHWSIGAWDMYSLDTGQSSGTSGNLTAGDKAWLNLQLAASTKRCQAVYWHHPRYSAGSHGSNGGLADDWQILMNHKVDLMLAGHDHNYQRYARMNGSGGVDQTNGVRSFVVGTGGRGHYTANGNPTGLEVKNANTFGLLRLALKPDSYDWRFLPAGGSFTDTGSEVCR